MRSHELRLATGNTEEELRPGLITSPPLCLQPGHVLGVYCDQCHQAAPSHATMTQNTEALRSQAEFKGNAI